jgi:tRNA nucleotidyltransferase (CCA-adding enzyme)
LMRKIVASGELETIAPERIWQEVARGLTELHPSRMLAVLRACGALPRLLPDIDRLFGVRIALSARRQIDAGIHLERAVDWAAAHGLSLPARYAVLVHDFAARRRRADPRTRVGRAEAISARLKVPFDCRDAARLVERWQADIDHADRLTPALILDLLQSADALRRPQRLSTLLATCEAIACSIPRASQTYRPADRLRDALRIVSSVHAGAIAKASKAATAMMRGRDGAIAKAVRAARIEALREWRRSN